MKQGTKKRLEPKDKHLKDSWKKRDAARKPLQEAHTLLLETEAVANRVEQDGMAQLAAQAMEETQ